MEDSGSETLVLRGEKDIYCRAFSEFANQPCQKLQSPPGLPNGSQSNPMVSSRFGPFQYPLCSPMELANVCKEVVGICSFLGSMSRD